MPKAMVAAQPRSSSAGSTAISPVGRSSARSNTFSPRSAAAQNWLIGAVPAAARATVSRVAAADRGETSRRATPWLPANTATSGRRTTGATTTVLTAADARRAGFDTADLSYTVPVATANGMARAAQVRVDALGVGRIVRTNVPVLVAEGQALGQSLLGMNFIGTLAGFDVRGDRMILRD